MLLEKRWRLSKHQPSHMFSSCMLFSFPPSCPVLSRPVPCRRSFHLPLPTAAVYGVARVLQESGDHTASRELLLFLGERSQELSQDGSPTAAAAAANDNGSGSRSPHACRLRFPLDNGGRAPGVRRDGDRSWEGGAGVAGLAAAPVLPVATSEVMWRVARASMEARDWATAALALGELASEAAKAPPQRRPSAVRLYYASFAGGGDAGSAPPRGPARARVLRALAFCQIQRGLYRDALKTVDEVLGGSGGSGGAAEGEDAAMLMLRAEALVSR